MTIEFGNETRYKMEITCGACGEVSRIEFGLPAEVGKVGSMLEEQSCPNCGERETLYVGEVGEV